MNDGIFTDEISEKIENFAWKNIGKRIYEIIK